MSSLETPEFIARAPWFGADLQTLRNVLRGPALSPPDAEETLHFRLPLSDGSGDQLAARLSMPQRAARRTKGPLVVLVHGLGGSEDSAYMLVTARYLLDRGYPVLRLNLRGAGASRPLCRGQYHAGRTADFRDALAALESIGGASHDLLRNGVVAVGYSLGGNMLLKYAAEFGALRGVASVSAPIDLAAASRRFLDARNRGYHIYLLSRIKAETLAAPQGVSEDERRLIPELSSILEFDDRFVAPRNGFADAADYYARNSAKDFLDGIEIPALVIHAMDDPWIPGDAYRAYPWRARPHLKALLAPSGGHVGFHVRGSRVPWHDQCLVRFLAELEDD